MDKFTKLTGVAAPLPLINVDTDMIIPKQFLKTIQRSGLGKNLFDEMRYDDDGDEIADFVLNQPAYRNAEILVAGENFGCGRRANMRPGRCWISASAA
jgi:3-isopropylmalate/(R)-2-methylmalate dehydratase small subunit